MSDPATPVTLVAVRDVVVRLGHFPQTFEDYAKLVEKYHIIVLAELPRGRGKSLFMGQGQADELIRKFAPVERDEVPESQSEIHLGALEAKVDRLNDLVRANTEATNLMIKQGNVLADHIHAALAEMKKLRNDLGG